MAIEVFNRYEHKYILSRETFEMAIKKPLHFRRNAMANLTGMQEPQYSLFYKFSISSIVRPVACAMISVETPNALKLRAFSRFFICAPSSLAVSNVLK